MITVIICVGSISPVVEVLAGYWVKMCEKWHAESECWGSSYDGRVGFRGGDGRRVECLPASAVLL